MSKQSINYKPQIGYTSDYKSDSARSISEVNVSIGPSHRGPFDITIIPSIEDNFKFLDEALKAIPADLSRAIREVYDPIVDIFYEVLVDKLVDPNATPPIIIIDPNPLPKDDIHPIILRPIDANGNQEPPELPQDEIHPIVLRPIKNDNKEDNPDAGYVYPIILSPLDKDELDEDNDIKAPSPIILHPIVDLKDPNLSKPDDDYEDDGDDEGLWDSPNVKVTYPEINYSEVVDKEFVFLLSKLLKYFTDTLKDIISNYIYNMIRNTVSESTENVKIILNNLELTSNDIVNHSKHLLDSSIKCESVTKVKTSFYKNSFNYKTTTTHIRSFLVTYNLRKRYTNIRYSRGQSMINATSDMILKQQHAKYEVKFRKDFENFYRFLNSSLKVTDDILRTHIQNQSSKSTMIKKGGIK